MELRQLKYFLKAQELLSFTEAAKHLNISQSTLSQQIKQLETELDVSLFNRIGKQITLTEPGRLFTEYAEQSVRKAEDGKLMLQDLKKIRVGTVTIGVAYDMTHTVHRAFSAKGLSPKFTIEVNDIPTAIRLVNSGNWYSIFIKTSVLGTTLASVAIRDDGLMRYAKIISLKGTYETESVKEFKKMLTISAKTLKLS